MNFKSPYGCGSPSYLQILPRLWLKAGENAEPEERLGPDAQVLGGLLDGILVLPDDGRAALGGDDGVEGVLEHHQLIAETDAQAAAAPALADDDVDDRRLQRGDGFQVVGDGLGLAALLRSTIFMVNVFQALTELERGRLKY